MALKSNPREYKPDLTVAELLATSPNKPDPPRRRRRSHGSKTKKPVGEFLFELFQANEACERRNKKTNAALSEIVIKEFPKRDRLAVALRSKVQKNGINMYRQKYNTGRLVPGRTVTHVSFRYNEDGDRVDYRTGKRILTTAQQREITARYSNEYIRNYKKFIEKAQGEDNG